MNRILYDELTTREKKIIHYIEMKIKSAVWKAITISLFIFLGCLVSVIIAILLMDI